MKKRRSPTIRSIARTISNGFCEEAIRDALNNDLFPESTFVIDFIQQGVGGLPPAPTANDIIQARFTASLANVTPDGSIDLDDEFMSLFPGLRDLASLDGSMDYASDLDLTLVFGVDRSGFYVLGESNVTLAISGSGSLSSDLNLLGTDATLSGEASTSLEFKLGGQHANRRFRLAEIANPAIVFEPTTDGSLTVTGELDFPDQDMTFSVEWTVDIVDGEVSDADLDGDGDPDRAPVILSATFDVPGLTVVDRDGSGQFTVRATIDFDELSLDAGLDAGADGTVDEITVGTLPVLLKATNVTAAALVNLPLTDVATEFPDMLATIRFSAGRIDFFPTFPDDQFHAFSELVSGELDLTTGELELSSLRTQIDLGQALQIVANETQIHFDPADFSAGAVLAEFGSATLRFPEFPQLPTTQIDALTIRRNGFSIGSFTTSGEVPLENEAPEVLELAGLTINGQDIAVTFTGSGVDVRGTITVHADQAAILPDITTPELDGLVTVTGFDGTIDLATGRFQLDAQQATVEIEGVVTAIARGTAEAPGLSLLIDPRNDDPSAVIATVNNLQLEFPALPGIDPELLSIDSLSIRRNGFDLVAELGGAGVDVTIGSSPELLTLDDLTILVDLHVRLVDNPDKFLPDFVVSGTLGLTASAAVLLPAGPFTATISDDDAGDELPAIIGSVNLTTGATVLQLRALQATLGGVIQIDAFPSGEVPAVSLSFDPNGPDDAVLFTLAEIVATIPALSAGGLTPSVSLEGFGLRRNGRAFLSAATLNLPDGYTNGSGIANLLPVEIQEIAIDFPDPDDLNTFVLGVTGQFRIEEFQSGLRSLLGPNVTPIVLIGQVDENGDPLPGTDTFSTANNGQFQFDLAVDSLRDGEVRPLNLGPITLGLTGLEVAGVTFDGAITLGGYQDGVFQDDISGFLEITAADPAQASGDFVGLRVEILPSSTIDLSPDGASLNLDARIFLDAEFGGSLGGIEVGGAILDLSLLLETSTLSASPFIRVDAFELTFGQLTIDSLDFFISDFIHVFATDITIFDPGQADGELARVGNATIEFLGPLAGLGQGSVDDLRLFDDRVEFANGRIDIPGQIGADSPLLEFTDLSLLTTDFVFIFDTGQIGAGTIGLAASEAVLLETATLTNLELIIGIDTNSFVFEADSLTADFDGVASIDTGPLSVRIDEGVNTLATIDAAVLSLPSIIDENDNPLSIILTPLAGEPALTIRRDGFSIGNLTHAPRDFEIEGIVRLEALQVTLEDLSYSFATGFDPIGRITVEAASGSLLLDNVAFTAEVSSTETLPGFRASVDLADGSFALDIGRIDVSFGDAANPLMKFSATGVALDLADPNKNLIEFATMTASLPAAPDPIGRITGDVTNFGIDKSLRPVALAGFSVMFSDFPSPSDLGLPGLISIQDFGVHLGDRFLSGLDLSDFVLTVSASLNLPLGDGAFTAAIEELTVDVGQLADGDLLAALDFGSFVIDFGTEESPIAFGPMSFFGGLSIENFDPTPEDTTDRNSIIVRFAGGATLAGIGLSGQLLITEYGPIAAGLNGSFSETGIPLGPVTLYEAGVLVMFNELVPDLPLNDPLKLIDPAIGEENEFDLSRFRRDGAEALIEAMNENARDFIVTQRASANPQPTWTTPFLFTLSGTFGPAGQPRSTAAFLADVTIGANIDPSTAEVLIFGLGEAFVGPSEPLPGGGQQPSLAIGTIGVVLDLSDLVNPTFQFAFATPSPGSAPSDLSALIPAEVRLGATFVKDGDELRLDVVGEVNVLGLLTADAVGTLTLDATGLYGEIQIAVGLSETGSDQGTAIDLSSFGDDISLEGQYELMFNFTGEPHSIKRTDRNDPNQMTQIDLPAATTRLFISGTLQAGDFDVSGAFLMQVGPEGLLVSASGKLILGEFGLVEAEGGLLFVAGSDGAGGAAGSLAILTDLSIPGLLDIEGTALLQFNSFASARSIEIPRVGGPSDFVSVDPGFFVRIAGLDADDPNSRARLSIFPADGELFFGFDRPIGLDFSARFELEARENLFAIHLAASIDVIVLDQSALSGEVTADLFIRDGVVFGTFSGSLSAGGSELGQVEGELDRFGCLHTNIPLFESLPPLPFFPQCAQRIFIEDQQFNEASGDQEILVRLTTKTADALTVRLSMSPVGDEGAVRNEHYSANQTITIGGGEKVGQIPVTFFDDDLIEPSRRFEVRIVSAEYPSGFLQAPNPIIENIEGRITIVDDDTPPTGPPVLIGITPVGGAQLDAPIVNGQPILAHISENAGPLSFELAPLSLQRADSVQVRARVFRVAGSDPVSEDFLGAGAVFAEQIVLLQGPRPLLLSFPLIDDAVAELHETFRVQFDLLQEARFAPSTSLQTDSALVTVRNDDPERPADAIVFYNFDGEAVPIIIPGEGVVGVDYAFTEAADFVDASLFASNIALSSGPVEAAAGLPKLEPSALPDDETPAAGAAPWDAQLAGPNLLRNGGAEAGARGDTSEFSSISAWVETAGDWNNRLFNDPEPATGNDLFSAGRITTSSRDGLNVLTQTVSLADFSGRIQSVEQGFRLSGQIFVDRSVGQIAVEFLDSARRIVGTETTEEIRVSADWVAVSVEGIVPLGTTAARVKLLATKTTAPTGTVPVYFDDVAFQLTDPEYFQFELTLDDAARTLENPEDFRSAPAIVLAGIDFWDMAGGDGPTI